MRLLNLFRSLLGLQKADQDLPFRFSESSADLVRWVIDKRSCPDCGSGKFYSGPEGGMSRNMLCAGCYAEFNFCLPFTVDRLALPGAGRLHVYGVTLT